MTRKPKPRQVARTVLLVGEGDAEVQFMQHLKGLYVRLSVRCIHPAPFQSGSGG